MRLTIPGVSAHREGEAFNYEGRRIQAVDGDSLAAALLASGERVCRTTLSGAPRGLFCGIGVCQDCLVTVDGVPNQRACVTAVRRDAVIESQRPLAELGVPGREFVEHDESMDVLVVGGGPAGLAAASVAAEAGLDVVLVDERGKLGGQYYKQPADESAVNETLVDHQFQQGREMIRRAERSGTRVLRGVTVWAAHGADEADASPEASGSMEARGPVEVMALGDAASYVLRPKRLIIATGAYDRSVPMPGWTLPGFMTTGAAQSLLRAYQVAPGERVLISGNGPLNVQLAAELTRAGVTVVALAELAPAPGLRSVGRLAAMLLSAPDLLRDGASYLRTLRRAGVPLLYGHSVIAASGDGCVAQATVARIDGTGQPMAGTERVYDVDAVCAGFGFLPSNDIPRALGCRHRFDEHRGHLVAVRDEHGRTTVDGIAVVGDGGGIGGGRVAVAQGVLAGIDASRGLGAGDQGALGLQERRAQKTLRRQARFQRALWTLYDAPLLVDQLATDETLICRCEEVTRGAVHEAMEAGVGSLGALKRVTRAGMGRCQGRYCAGIMAGMLPRRGDRATDEMDFFAPRAPFKPIPIGAVAPGRFTDSDMARRGRTDE